MNEETGNEKKKRAQFRYKRVSNSMRALSTHPTFASEKKRRKKKKKKTRKKEEGRRRRGKASSHLTDEIAESVGDAARAGFVIDGVRRHQFFVAVEGVKRQPPEKVYGCGQSGGL